MVAKFKSTCQISFFSRFPFSNMNQLWLDRVRFVSTIQLLHGDWPTLWLRCTCSNFCIVEGFSLSFKFVDNSTVEHELILISKLTRIYLEKLQLALGTETNEKLLRFCVCKQSKSTQSCERLDSFLFIHSFRCLEAHTNKTKPTTTIIHMYLASTSFENEWQQKKIDHHHAMAIT